jgi:hypothetical protein|tara:strand:- start:504 stop:623 length:120 start_codon:yes stop_codon:yes gene_type:complete
MDDRSDEIQLLGAIHTRLGWIAFWLFLIVCGVGQSVVLF